MNCGRVVLEYVILTSQLVLGIDWARCRRMYDFAGFQLAGKSGEMRMGFGDLVDSLCIWLMGEALNSQLSPLSN